MLSMVWMYSLPQLWKLCRRRKHRKAHMSGAAHRHREIAGSIQPIFDRHVIISILVAGELLQVCLGDTNPNIRIAETQRPLSVYKSQRFLVNSAENWGMDRKGNDEYAIDTRARDIDVNKLYNSTWPDSLTITWMEGCWVDFVLDPGQSVQAKPRVDLLQKWKYDTIIVHWNGILSIK